MKKIKKEIKKKKEELNNIISSYEKDKQKIEQIAFKIKMELNAIQEKYDKYEKQKNELENKTFVQLIKIKIIIDEIERIQMNKNNRNSIDIIIKDILNSKEEYSENKKVLNSLFQKFNEILKELDINEEKVLLEYNIDKNKLLDSQKDNNKKIKRQL